MSNLISQFDPSKIGNFELQIYTNEKCENQRDTVLNWTSTSISTPSIAGPDSEIPTGSVSLDTNFKPTANTFSFKFLNQSIITHAIHYEVYKASEAATLPTINSPSLVANPKQFSSTVTITELDTDTEYMVQFSAFFLGQGYSGGQVSITTDSNVANPNPSTINQNLVFWERQPLEKGDFFKINAHSAFNDPPYSAPSESNFCNSYYFEWNPTTRIKNIADYVLQRGWLQNIDNSVISGWTISIIGENKIVNLDVSDSNSYNAIVDLASLSNMQIKIDYINKIIIFIDKESATLDKNYTLQRDFNLQDFGISYSGENMSSIFYVDAAEDEFGLRTLLSDETPYRDNFLFDFNYFRSKDLISESELTIMQNKINIDLKKINEKLVTAIKDRFNHLGLIRQSRAQIESIAELLAVPQKFDDYSQRFLDLQSQFFRPSIGTKQVTRTENVKTLNIFWNNLKPNVNITTPIKFNYFGINYTQTDPQQTNGPPSGPTIEIFFEDASDRIPWPSASANPKVYLKIRNDANVEFDISRFNIISVNANFNLSIQENEFEFIYPYFTLLDEFDGSDAIMNELQRIRRDVQTFKDFKTEDETELACLIGDDPNAPGCEKVRFSDNFEINQARITFLESRIEDYKAAIGQELNGGGFIPGKFTLIQDTFERYLNDYIIPEDTETIMSIYRKEVRKKQKFWYDLKNDKQHIFIEAYYQNEFETDVSSLKSQAEAAFNEHNKPLEDFNLSYIDLSDIVGINIQDISAGDFVTLKERKLDIITNSESKLKVASISKVLRDKGNINLTIFRYNMINQIIEKLIARNQ